MLISHRYKFLFVHIAKTGGTSVRAALSPLRWRDPSYYLQFICSRFSHLTGHRIATKLPRHAKIIAAKEMLPREYFDQLYKFAFVRNPWDLQVSSYHHIRRERPQLIEHIKDFKGFIKWKLDPDRPYQYHIDTSIEHQTDYLIDLGGAVIVDFVGRYENLKSDFDDVCKKVGIKPIELPHKREAKDREAYKQYYDDITAQLIADYFKRDIELFKYGF